MTIRSATEADSAALLHIYAQYMETPVTFEYELPTPQAFARRIAGIRSEYPYLVCEEQGRVIGYAYAHRQMERAAYQWNAELSVYLDKDHTGRGLGKALYTLLIEILKQQNVKTVYGGVTVPNQKSENLHAALGFRRLGTYHRTGYKCGAWHDVAWFEKQIAPYEADPAPFRPVCEIDSAVLNALMQTQGR